MEQKKKEVVFDGKDLIFNVDGIEIKNGKLPDSFSIKELSLIHISEPTRPY